MRKKKPQQVRIRKTNNPEPLLTRRNPEIDIETGSVSIFHYKSIMEPDYCIDGVRRIGGVILIWASIGNCGK